MIPSLYAMYIKEREGFETLEDDRGFATYIINGDECYIRDIFVKPEFRNTDVASQYAGEISEIAKSKGCRHLVGTVSPLANGATASLKILLAYGFKLYQSLPEKIIFTKEIK